MGSISVFSKIPNLFKELCVCMPNLKFYEVMSEKDKNLKDCEIVIGDFHLLAPVLYDLPNTKWLQGTWAGVDKIMPYLDVNKPLPYTITRYSGKHFGRMMAEYVLSSIVNHERDNIKVYNNQISKIWSQEGKIGCYRIISDLKIGVMGMGQIGSWICDIFHKFGATVYGFGRRASIDENMKKIIREYYDKPKLPEFLKKCDYVVNVLPNTTETRGLLGGSILENCKDREAVFINVGRGSIISDDDLIEALNKKWLSAAILDVFNMEPLPPNCPLWSMPQVKITPHVSATSLPKHIAEQFRENYELYVNNKPIPTTLDISRGY